MTERTTLGVWCLYAPQDQLYFKELGKHLAPLLRAESLQWARTLHGAHLLLILVSADLDGHLEQHPDLPAQIRQRAEQGAVVIQIKIRPAVAEALIDIKLQTLPRPPGSHVHRDTEPQRDAVWLEVAEEIRTAAVQHPARRQRPLVGRQAPPRPQARDGRHELYVRLDRQGAALRVSYHRHGAGAVGQVPSAQSLPAGLRPDAVSGADLFHLLFPDEAVWRPVLRGLFGAPNDEQSVPTRHPVRLRLWTADAELGALPWHRATYGESSLGGDLARWTFEVSPDGPGPARTLVLPCAVLVFLPDPADEPQARGVESVLRAALPRGAPLRCTVARDAAELTRALLAKPPIFYCVGSGDGDGLRCSDRVLPYAELRDLLRAAPPLIAFFDLRGAPDGLAAGLSAAVPLCAQARAGTDRDLVLRWLGEMLRSRREPVFALYEATRQGAQEAPRWDGMPALYSHGSLELYAPETRQHDAFAPLRLDRDTPRALVKRHIEGLIASRRVEALVVYAAPGNLLERFIEQALDEVVLVSAVHVRVELLLPEAQVVTKGMEAEAAQDMKERIIDALRLKLGRRGDEELPQLLRQPMPKDAASGPGVLWLDCGVQGRDFKKTHLAGWLDFCQALAAPGACPDDLRVVAYLALLRGEDEHQKLAQQLEAFEDLQDDRFRLSHLPPLPPVKRSDLRNYLYDRAHSDLRGDLVAKAVDLILKATKGRYADTVAILERAQKLGWDKVLSDLSLQVATLNAPDDDDDE